MYKDPMKQRECERRWREEHATEIKAQRREYYLLHRAEIIKRNGAYAQANRPARLAYYRRYNARRPESYNPQRELRRRIRDIGGAVHVTAHFANILKLITPEGQP